MYHYQFYFPFLLTLESLKDQDVQESEQDWSLFWMWNSPPVYLVLFTFYAIMMLIEIVIVSDMWSNHVMTCWCLFFYGPLAPQMNSFNNIVTGVFSWYTKVTENLAYNNIKMGTCHVPPPGIKWINQSREYTYYQKLLFYIKPQSEEIQQKVQNL